MDLTIRDRVTDAIHYWEPRRLLYNGILIIVVAYFWFHLAGVRRSFNLDLALIVFNLAVLANVAYCAAYVVDLFAQTSGYRDLWQRYRVVVFSVGTLFAAILTRWFSLDLFGRR
jgi:nucleoside recognition membrane protein YjiH